MSTFACAVKIPSLTISGTNSGNASEPLANSDAPPATTAGHNFVGCQNRSGIQTVANKAPPPKVATLCSQTKFLPAGHIAWNASRIPIPTRAPEMWRLKLVPACRCSTSTSSHAHQTAMTAPIISTDA